MSSNQFWRNPAPSASTSTLPGTPIPSVASIRKSLPSFPSPPLRVSRVGQLDAALLDHELEGILGGPLWKALEGIRGGGSAGKGWEAELMLLLRVVILRMSVFESGATYGATLQNLKYRNEFAHTKGLQSTAVDSRLTPLQLNLYTVLTVLPSYLSKRLQDTLLSSSWSDHALPSTPFALLNPLRLLPARHAADRRSPIGSTLASEWKRLAYESTLLLEKFGQVVGLVNFLVFLYDGRFRSVGERILGMRLIYNSREVGRNVSFEFLNRQLVWEAFTEFLLFLMPLINLHKLRLRALKFLAKTSTRSKSLSAVFTTLPLPFLRLLGLPPRAPPVVQGKKGKGAKGEKEVQEKNDGTKGPYGFLSATICPICYSQSTAALSAPPTSLPSPSPSSTSTTSSSSSTVPANTTLTPEETRIKVPYLTDCSEDWECRYCYYCIVGALVRAEEEGEEGWNCLRCAGVVTEVRGEKDGVLPLFVPQQEEEEEEEEEEEVGEEHDNWR